MCSSIPHHQPATVPDDYCYPECSYQIDQREEYRVVEDGIDVRISMIVVDVVKRASGLLFGIEDLHCLRAGNVFLQKCVYARYARPHHVIPASRMFPEPRSRAKQQWYR